MAYTFEFKLRTVLHVKRHAKHKITVAKIKKVPIRTIYRWLAKYERYGESGLHNRKPGAKTTKTTQEFNQVVLDTWNKRPRGSHKMWLDLTIAGYGVSQRQIQKVYRLFNLKMSKRSRPSQIKFVKYEWPEPNMLWHTDWTICPFTGKYLIAFIDDYSRYIIFAAYYDHATTENTILAFRLAIAKCGKPQAILTDNGAQFTPARSEQGQFAKFCESSQIKHILGRINHPQTNGKIERWFGTYKQEFLHGKDSLDSFVKFYNEERRHQGIGYIVPLQRYASVINAV